MVRQLLDYSEYPNERKMNGLIANITDMVAKGGRLDAVDSEGRTALMYAVLTNDERITSFLLQSLSHMNTDSIN